MVGRHESWRGRAGRHESWRGGRPTSGISLKGREGVRWHGSTVDEGREGREAE